MIREILNSLVNGNNLKEEESLNIFLEIMSGKIDNIELSSFLTAMNIKGITSEELTGAAKAMKKNALKIKPFENAIDIVGTGGDEKGTFNISTASAFIVSGAGLCVAKHGNVASTSKCGTADVLLELGVNINADVDIVEKCIEEVHMGFLFAKKFHTSMKYAALVRKTLPFRTIFNLLGPLTNPCDVKYNVLGVYDQSIIPLYIKCLKSLGSKHAAVFSSKTGVDEISLDSISYVTELIDVKEKEYIIDPEKIFKKKYSLSDIKGNTAKDNAKILLSILDGEHSPYRDVALLNSSMALIVGEKVDNIFDGIKLAEESIDSGKAKNVLNKLIEVSNDNFR